MRDPFQRKWSLHERSDGEPQQNQRIVVAGAAVQMENLAAGASVNENPLSVSTHRDGDRLHERAAIRRPVPGAVVVQMTAPQAVRTVVPMSGTEGVDRHIQPAVPASERIALATTPCAMALIA
jgi:hypothetical protein